MKDYSVTKRAGHKFNLGITVFDKENGKPCVIVGYAGLPGGLSYCVQYDGDPGMDKSMPFRYRSETDLTTENVTFSVDASEIIARLQAGEFVAFRERDFLVQHGHAVYTFDDPESERPTGLRLKDYRDVDGNVYSDQAGLEENPGRL